MTDKKLDEIEKIVEPIVTLHMFGRKNHNWTDENKVYLRHKLRRLVKLAYTYGVVYERYPKDRVEEEKKFKSKFGVKP
jgi:hypothetical protein